MYKPLILLVRFALELVLLFALGYWGFHYTGHGIGVSVLAGIGLPLFAAVVWGAAISPKAKFKLPLTTVLLLEFILFAVAFLCLYDSGFETFAIVFAVAEIVDRGLIVLCNIDSSDFKGRGTYSGNGHS
jgi:hypothetical protein